MSKYVPVIVVCAAFLSLVSGCRDDDESAGTGQLKMYLLNVPASYDSVVVVVKEVSVHSETRGWIALGNTIRTFDLVTLTGGIPSLLGEALLEAGQYTRIRMVTDTGSYVIVNGKHRPIAIKGGFEKELTLVHRFQIEANLPNTLYIDFDANGGACICRCCDQFTSRLHASMNLETPGNYVQRRLKAERGFERCKCGDRWDHREQNGKRCHHCTSKNNRISAIG